VEPVDWKKVKSYARKIKSLLITSPFDGSYDYEETQRFFDLYRAQGGYEGLFPHLTRHRLPDSDYGNSIVDFGDLLKCHTPTMANLTTVEILSNSLGERQLQDYVGHLSRHAPRLERFSIPFGTGLKEASALHAFTQLREVTLGSMTKDYQSLSSHPNLRHLGICTHGFSFLRFGIPPCANYIFRWSVARKPPAPGRVFRNLESITIAGFLSGIVGFLENISCLSLVRVSLYVDTADGGSRPRRTPAWGWLDRADTIEVWNTLFAAIFSRSAANRELSLSFTFDGPDDQIEAWPVNPPWVSTHRVTYLAISHAPNIEERFARVQPWLAGVRELHLGSANYWGDFAVNFTTIQQLIAVCFSLDVLDLHINTCSYEQVRTEPWLTEEFVARRLQKLRLSYNSSTTHFPAEDIGGWFHERFPATFLHIDHARGCPPLSDPVFEIDEFDEEDCPMGWHPNSDRTECKKFWMKVGQSWATMQSS
jgi:hypothetical protein